MPQASVDSLTAAIKTFDKALDMVMKQPRGPKRWRAANNLWLLLAFKNQKVYKEVCADNAQTRASVDKFGQESGLTHTEKADKTMRECLNIPAGAYIMIAKADPDAFLLKENSEKMFREFPEYRTREVW